MRAVMTPENLTATFGMSLQLTFEDGRYAARRRSRRHVG
jgi:iron complex transport system ATP-binding protein